MKRERERCGISIRDVMDVTKISRRNLTALEDGQVESLPHPVYLKGYVRNIAQMVGLSGDELASAVDQQYDPEASKYLPQAPVSAPLSVLSQTPSAEPACAPPSSVASPEPVLSRPAAQHAPAPQRHASAPERGSPRFMPEPFAAPKPKTAGAMRSVVALVLLVAALIGLLVQYQRQTPEAPPPPPAPVALPAASSINATDQENASALQDNATGEAVPVEPASASMPAAPSAHEPQRAAAPAAPAHAPSASTAQGAPAASIVVTRNATVGEVRTPGLQQLTITAKADEVCWVQITDGQQHKSFTLRNGESRQVEFASRLRVRMGNAGGVSFRLNGQDHPFEGKRGSIETVEFGAR